MNIPGPYYLEYDLVIASQIDLLDTNSTDIYSLEYHRFQMQFETKCIPSSLFDVSEDGYLFVRFNPNLEESIRLKNFFYGIDEYFASNEFRQTFFGSRLDGYQYQTISENAPISYCKLKFCITQLDDQQIIQTQFKSDNVLLNQNDYQRTMDISNLIVTKPFIRIVFNLKHLWINSDSFSYGINATVTAVAMQISNSNEGIILDNQNINNQHNRTPGIDFDQMTFPFPERQRPISITYRNFDADFDGDTFGRHINFAEDPNDSDGSHSGVSSDSDNPDVIISTTASRASKIISNTIEFRLGQTEFRFNEDNQCRICFEDYVDGDQISILECEHDLHKVCLDSYFRINKNNCPVCRLSLIRS